MAGAFASNDGPAQAVAAVGTDNQPLPPAVRADYEYFFGTDLSSVRIHAGAAAADTSRSIRAKAFALGSDIYFGSGQYRPDSGGGRRLLAHELAHVVRGHEGLHLSPEDPEGSETIHQELIEEYRAAHGLPPHGIDPVTGQQVGPTDDEIRFGPLNPWVRGRVGVAAPSKAPAVVEAGTKDVKTPCAQKHEDDDNQDRDKYHACRRHQEYVQNVLPQAIDNIRNVPSPFSPAIVALYSSALPQLQRTEAPRAGGPSVGGKGSPGTLAFGGATHTFANFAILVHQRFSEANGSALSLGGPNAIIELNETSPDAALKNLPAIENTLVHEATHIFMRVIEEQNANRAAGAPVVEPSLEREAYAGLHNRLENSVFPYVTRIRQLPSQTAQSLGLSAQTDAWLTAMTLLAETFAFTEAEIYEKQRAGQEFSARSLGSLPPFLYSFAYWEPTPPVERELEIFLEANRAQIKRDVEPVILQIAEKYLSLRP